MPSPTIDGAEFDTSEDLIKAINTTTKQHGYAVKIRSSKLSRFGIKNKVVISCSRGGKTDHRSKPTGARNAKSRLINCPFLCHGELDPATKKWSLTSIIKENHNHDGALEASHPGLRKYFMNRSEVMADIRAQANSLQKPDQILTFLTQKYELSPESPIVGHKDIYNALQKIREEALGNRTAIQALNVALHNDDDWFCRQKLDRKGRVEHLFFINTASKEMIKAYGELLILDCTYKTNRYRMPLAIMTEVTDLNTSFYAGMCFMKGEDLEDYKWLIQTIKELYQELDIPLPLVWLSDGEINIPKAIALTISPTAIHILCIWHIERNIVDNCRKYIREKDAWNTFFQKQKSANEEEGTPAVPQGNWRKVQYSKTVDDFDLAWYNLQQKYDAIDPRICEYLENNIISKKRKWHPIGTDQVMHFGNHVSSRGERQHSVLKTSLGIFVGDLDMVAKAVSIVCNRQRSEYLKALDKTKQRLAKRLKKNVLQDLFIYIIPQALELILSQYQMLLDAQKSGRPRPTCTEQFKITLGLPCSHVIERRLADTENGGRLKLLDVHYYWHFQKSDRHYKEPVIEADFIDVDDITDAQLEPVREPLFDITNPAIVKPKGRPRGAPNQPRSTTTRDHQTEALRAFENSTRRNPSSHEYREAEAEAEAMMIDLTHSQVQIPASQPPPTQARKRKATSQSVDGGGGGSRGGTTAIQSAFKAKASRKRRPTKADLEAENKQLKKALKTSGAASIPATAEAFEGVISRPSKDVVDVGSEDDNADLPEL